MPLREFRCPDHGRFEELFQGEYPKTLGCPVCGRASRFVFSAPRFRFGFWYGWDAGAGVGFDTARQRDNYLAEHGLEKIPEGVYGKEGADIRS